MYRHIGVEKGYEDAIPVKRSRRSERLRSEARREAASKKTGVNFVLNKADTAKRSIPKDTAYSSGRNSDGVTESVKMQAPAALEEPTAAVRVREIPKASPTVKPAVKPVPKPVPKPVRPPVKPWIPPISKIADDAAEAAAAEISVSESDAAASDELSLKELAAENENDVAPAAAEASADSDPLSVSRDLSEGSGERVGDMLTIYRESSTVTEKKKRRYARKGRLTVGKVIGRFLLSVFTLVVLLVSALFGGLYAVANGPSESVRNTLVLSALQASATKWVPGLFLEDEVVDQILADSQKVNTDVISVEDYEEQQTVEEVEDRWANAIDGMIYEPVNGPTFKGYVLLVKDPSRVSVGVASNGFSDATVGMRIFDMADKYGAVAAINGGEYPDAGGMGSGGRPIGITYSQGECVWSDGLRRSFMGFDKDNRLIVREGLTKAEAEALGIRDGVCFKTGKTLITNEDGNVTMYYADNDTGTAQRTAIGQSADGTVILLVTDGRTASSLGATHNDVIDIMVSYGAISAGMLDGGSSSLMYYRDFYDKYGLDKTDLDEYQKKGLINKYKAFTNPRRMPTCFVVAPE